MTPEELKKALAKGISPVYLVLGTSSFLVENSVKIIKKAALGGGIADFNLNSFRAGQDDLGPVRSIARTLPMMAKRRVLVIAQAEELSEEERGFLNDLAKEEIDTTCLIVHGRSFDKRIALAKAAKKNGGLVEFEKLTAPRLGAWAKRMAHERGKKLADGVINIFIQHLGDDLDRYEKEIEKAALYVGGDEETIDADALLAVMVMVKQERVFDLMDAVGLKKRARALFFLDGMLESGNHPIRVHATIYRHMKKLLMAKALAFGGMDRDAVVRKLGGHPFPMGKVVDQARNYSPAELRRAMAYLSKADFELKDGRASDKIVLEKMILDLCRD